MRFKDILLKTCEWIFLIYFKPRLPKEGGYTLPSDCFRCIKTQRKAILHIEASLSSSFAVIDDFYWRGGGGRSKDSSTLNRQSLGVCVRRGGWLPLQKILSRHFEKYLHAMELIFTAYFRSTISPFYEKR